MIYLNIYEIVNCCLSTLRQFRVLTSTDGCICVILLSYTLYQAASN